MIDRVRHIRDIKTDFVQKSVSTVLFLLFIGLAVPYAQTSNASEHQVKAVFLYNFSHFVDWPADAFESPYEFFIIGVIGNDPFGNALEAAVEGERIGTHVIRIQRYDDVSQIRNCHILFVAEHDPDEVRRIINTTSGKPILTVGDTPNFIRWGGMIRFYTEENKIRLQINNTAAKNALLKISSKLLRVSQVS